MLPQRKFKMLWNGQGMKLTKFIYILGWSCIIAGLALSFYNNYFAEEQKEEIKTEIKDIYYKSKQCLKELLYFESRNTSIKEREAILDVTLNRYKHKNYPSTICEVVQQDKQYSYRNNLQDKSQTILPAFQNINSILDQKAYLEIEEIVDNRFQSGSILPNKVLPENALWYHTKQIGKKPKWSRSKNIKQIVVDKTFVHRYYVTID